MPRINSTTKLANFAYFLIRSQRKTMIKSLNSCSMTSITIHHSCRNWWKSFSWSRRLRLLSLTFTLNYASAFSKSLMIQITRKWISKNCFWLDARSNFTRCCSASKCIEESAEPPWRKPSSKTICNRTLTSRCFSCSTKTSLKCDSKTRCTATWS